MDLDALLAGGLRRGLFCGATAAVSGPGGTPRQAAVGTLAADDPTPVTASTLVDLDSLTQVLTACVVLALADVGALDLDRPTERGFTLAQLLSHTSGLPARSAVWRRGDLRPAQRLATALGARLESAPGAEFRCSRVGYVTAGHLAEEATGQGLDSLAEELVTAPLGIRGLRFGPVGPADVLATGRGDGVVLRGEVNDEFAASLRRPVGGAGLFGTAAAVHALVRMVVDGGLAPDGTPVLSPEAVARMTTSQLPAGVEPGSGHGLGLRIGDEERTAGAWPLSDTGSTGASVLLDPRRGRCAVLLTDRVHPDRSPVDLGPFRREFAKSVAEGLDARP